MNSSKYRQKLSRKKVLEMIKRGWSVRQTVVTPRTRPVHPDAADVWNHEAYVNKVGWVLVDPDDYIVSPTIREFASEAWDDLWSD